MRSFPNAGLSSLPARVAWLYGGAGAVWILSTDLAVSLAFSGSAADLWFGIVKGLFFVAASAGLIYLVMRKGISSIVQADQQVQQLNRTLQAISAANSVLVRSASEAELLQGFCDALVGPTGHRLVWVGLVTPSDPVVRVEAHAGQGGGYLEGIEIRCDDSPAGRGPTGKAIRLGAPVVSENIAVDEQMIPWRERAAKFGMQSSIAVPLRAEAGVLGAFTLYSGEANRFGEAEVKLLLELAADLAYGIVALRRKAELVGAVERLRASEDRLSRERALLRTLLDSIPDLIFYKDNNLAYLGCNRAFEAYSGMRESDLVGRSDLDLAPREVAEPYRAKDREVLASGRPQQNEEWIPFKSGGGGHFETLKTPYCGPAGEMLGLIGISRDITERKRRETELQRVSKILQAAMDCSQAGIAIAEAPSGQLLYVNQAGLRIRGAAEEKLVTKVTADQYGKAWNVRNPDGSPMASEEIPLAQAVLHGKPCSRELLIRRDDGEDRCALTNAAPIFESSGKVVAGVAVFLDVTERRRAEAALAIQNQNLERFNRLAVGREMQMIVLKKEVNELCRRLGEAPRHRIVDDARQLAETTKDTP